MVISRNEETNGQRESTVTGGQKAVGNKQEKEDEETGMAGMGGQGNGNQQE